MSSARRAERLVNLVLCLLSSQRELSAARLRQIVPGYQDVPSDEAFFRMFDRDKAELRELGVPLETVRSPASGTAEAYRIARRDYELPEIDLEPDEAAAVALAGRLWDSSQLAGAAHGALLKLRAAGVEVEAEPATLVEPRIPATHAALTPLISAVQAGQVVRFQHRRHPAAEAARRTLEPWGVVSWRGRWYVVGHDRDRDATRCFRVSRIVGTVQPVGEPGAVRRPDGTDLLDIVTRSVGGQPFGTQPVGGAGGPPATPTGTATSLWLAAGHAQGLRRRATPTGALAIGGVEGDVVSLELPGIEVAARWIAGYGPDVVVLHPPELAAAVRERLRAALRAGESLTTASRSRD